MSTIDDKLINSISQPVAEQEVQVQEPSPVMEQQAPPAEPQTAPPADAAPVQEPQVTNEPATPAAEPVDYNKFVSELSGGAFADVEALKSALPKFSGYDTLSSEKEALATAKAELEKQLQETAPANDYVKIFNKMIKDGASKDQLENYQKINNIGELNDLSPIDAKVAKLVLVDGYRESIARKMVEKDFPLDDYDEGSDERAILEEQLRVQSNGDREALSKFKADLTQVDNSAQENTRLQQLAATEQHKQSVSTYVPQIAQSVQGMGELEFKPKEGDAVKIKFDYPDEFKSTIPSRLTEFFMDGNTPVTKENVDIALRHVNAVYLDENFPKIAQKIWADAENATWEKAVNKYENRSGLPNSPEIQVNPNNQAAEMNSFLRNIVGKS